MRRSPGESGLRVNFIFCNFFVLVGDRNDNNQQYVNLLEDGTATQDCESFVSQLPSQFQNRYTPTRSWTGGGKEIKWIMHFFFFFKLRFGLYCFVIWPNVSKTMNDLKSLLPNYLWPTKIRLRHPRVFLLPVSPDSEPHSRSNWNSAFKPQSFHIHVLGVLVSEYTLGKQMVCLYVCENVQ